MISFIPPTSRIRRTVRVIGIVCLLTIFAGVIFVAAHKYENQLSQTDSGQNGAPDAVDSAVKARIAEDFGRLPLSFEINKGQIDQSVKFLSHGPGYDLFLTSNEAVLRVPKQRALQADKPKGPAAAKERAPTKEPASPKEPASTQEPVSGEAPASAKAPAAKESAPANGSASTNTDADADVREGTVLRLKLLGTNGTPQVEGQDELPGKVNYFTGSDPANWHRNIPTYRKAYFKNVYPGIDVVYYGNQQELEYDLIVAARANPKLIRFTVAGADKVRLDKTGRLLLTLKHGEVSLNKPMIYQLNANGGRREVKGGYVLTGNEVRFKLEAFDSSKPLVIDPVLSYSTLLGSSSNDSAVGIAVDSQGNAYVTGATDGTNFPTTAGAFKATSTRSGAFVSKLNPTGTALVYSTYLTSNFGSVNGTAIAVDSAGNAHVTGTTSATDFPIVNGLKTTSNFFKTTDAAANWNNQNSGLVGGVNGLAIASNAPNTIYAATSDGIYRSTDGGANWTKTTGTGLSGSTFATAIAVDPTNSSVVYIGTFNGFFKTTDGGNNWSNVTTIPLSFASVFSIVFDPSTPATMYIGAGNGVFKSTDSGNTWITQNNFGIPGVPNVRALAISPTAPLTIYAGTSGNGLFKSTNGGGVWTAMNNGMGGSSPTFINTIAIDPANTQTIYTGHGSQGGINKSTNGAGSWAPLTNGVPNTQINAIVATSSAVYAATSGNGVIKTTNGGTSWTNANAGLWTSFVSALVRHPTNATTLYVGTNLVTSNDAFVTKLNASGSGLLFSTLLGGSSEDNGNDIAVDGSGNIYVAGQTNAPNFPVVNAVQGAPTTPDNCISGFVTKMNPAVPSFVFSTYLRGSQCDTANSVATDTSGNVYVTGLTSSTDFLTANAFQPALASQFNFDAFVTKLTSTGSLVYSTYLGGSSTDQGFGIAADASGNAYITGFTSSTNFPTMNPIQATNNGFSSDVFVTKLNSQGSALVYSTYLGGSSGEDVGRGIALDSANNVYVAGFTNSTDFPLVAGALRTRSPIFKSLDGAANWSNDNYGLTTSSILALAVHPTEPSTVYAATNRGVFKTINGGRTWSPINTGLDSLNVFTLVIDRVTPSTLYVATNDFSGINGVYKSIDGGNTWNRRVNGMASTRLATLAIDPVTPNTLYAAVFDVPGTRIYKTTDGADNWAPVGNTPPLSPVGVAVDPLNHTTLYAVDSSNAGGVFKSTNSGVTWQPVGLSQTGPFGRSVAVSPLTPGLLYAETSGGLFKSVNGGTNWTLIPNRTGQIVFDPVSPSTVYLLPFASFPGLGVFKSTDNGQTWVAVNNGLNTQTAVVALAINPTKSSTLYIASASTNGSDAFVTKINPAGNSLIYSTLIGGPLGMNNFSNVSGQAFGIALDPAGNAYITGTTSAAGFPVSATAFQPFLRGFSDAFISKLTSSYIISGKVLTSGGAPVSDAEIVLRDGTSLTSVLTESDGSYQFSRLRDGGTITITASKPHFTMAPASQTFANLKSDQVLNFTATATAAAFHTISGKVTENGAGLGGVIVTLSGSQPGLRTTDSNGNYSFELAGGGNYTVTPSVVGFNFAPANLTFNDLAASQTANFTATRQSFVVTNTNNHGAGSLREAVINANATLGTDTIVFNIPGTGVKTINLAIALPEITERVVIDGTTQPGFAGTPLIEIDGLAIGTGNGLIIKAGGSTVRGLSLGNFRSDSAIWLNGSDNNTIQGNYLGVAANGTTARPNSRGILLSNSNNNVIGGSTAAARNVISGNMSGGIEINGNSNTVQGNYIGTNAAGTAALQNPGGVTIPSSQFTNNVIGGTAAGAGNLVSGNQTGISTFGTGTTIQGNLIGTDVTGTKAIPNSSGIFALGQNITVGGLGTGSRNVISGNLGDGVTIRGVGTKLQGNFVGTDITGTLSLGNRGNGVVAGEGALIGGTVPQARNIISANGNLANIALGNNSSGNAATVQGNYIGTDVTGTRALDNSAIAGINISSNNNLIGGVAAGARNIISGNRIGIQLGGFFSAGIIGNVIQGNFIGLNAVGTGSVPNANQGISISDAVNSTIGGTQSGAGNRIAFNNGPGVTLSTGNGNSIRGNSIFSNNGLGIDLGTPSGVTPNDLNDADTGPNQLQNFPVITTVMSTSNSTTIQGSLKSIPNTTFQIDFYSNAAVDPSGNGEGAQFFNSTSVNTNNNGDATINVTFPVALATGRVITATATDPNGNTSEFSASNSIGAAGSVQFTASALQVIEDVGLATVTVLRTGGSSGNLTVNYATANGTALAGQDYTATSGTLTFSGGETSKTIQIPITNDSPTEPDETFTVTLSNTPSLENLGSPSVLTVTIQDRTTVPVLTVNSAFVTEGNTGTTTDMLFTVNLSAATGRTVSVSYATLNFNAFGGGACSIQGADYEMASGALTFQPGSTTFTIPVKICGDTSAEANENFIILLSNPSGALILLEQGVGTIIDDDILELALEESGPNPNQAVALDARLGVRDPFRVFIPDWLSPTENDQATRVAFFARNLQLNPGEPSSAVRVRFTGDNGAIFEIPAEDVRPVPNSEFTQVTVRLFNTLTPGTYTVFIRAHARTSNTGVIRIVP